MAKETALVHFEKAKRELAQATSIDEVKSIRDKAQALRTYAKQQSDSHEMQNQCAEIKLRAERRAGELLAESPPKHTGRKPEKTSPGKNKSLEVTNLSLDDIGITKNQSSAWQKISKIPEEIFENHIEETKADGGELTTAGTLRLTDAPHISRNSGENEWYTPTEFIESAREVMGGIDLDPASSAKANKIVKAEEYFTAEENGLNKPWHGRVWLNPPYAQPLVSMFAEKLLTEIQASNTPQAVVLVNNATETKWFQQLAGTAVAICFPSGRIKFWQPEKEPGNPLQGQAILGTGVDIKRFTEVFRKHGLCMVKP